MLQTKTTLETAPASIGIASVRDGRDAQEMYELGLLGKAEMEKLTRRAAREMELKGFRVLDNKPRHCILREWKNGGLLRRNGELVYALIDFELLQRTEEYEAFLHARCDSTGKSPIE